MEMTSEKRAALSWIDANAAGITGLSDRIWHHAEPALREYKSAQEHCEILRGHGFKVEEGIAGMPTAFRATWGAGRPIIGFYAEYDATPGISQYPVPYRSPIAPEACGFHDLHNGLGAGSTGAALATKAIMERFNIPGDVVLLGTPAEKLCVGKSYLARDGFLDPLDVMLGWHPYSQNTVCYDHAAHCYMAMVFDFHGLAAYGGCPWMGRSALDAVTLMNVSVNYMKEHIPRDLLPSVNETITIGGLCPTIIPEYARVWYVFRATTKEAIEGISAMLERCAEAASLVTGCTYSSRIAGAARPWLPNHTLARKVFAHFERVGPPEWTEEDKGFAQEVTRHIGLEPLEEPLDTVLHNPEDKSAWHFAGGADDVTEFSWHTPTCWLHVAYFIQGPEHAPIPSWAQASLSKTGIGHRCLLTAAKVLSISALEFLTNPEALRQVRGEFDERLKNGRMETMLPPDSKPPIELSFPPYYPEGWRPPVHLVKG